MVFLFVGSSALTEASFPRDLAIPQLLLSSACAIVLSVKDNTTAVFPHRGLAPHQVTPMSGAHKIAPPNRRLRLGPVPWSFGTLTSHGSAVGELDRDMA